MKKDTVWKEAQEMKKTLFGGFGNSKKYKWYGTTKGINMVTDLRRGFMKIAYP